MKILMVGIVCFICSFLWLGMAPDNDTFGKEYLPYNNKLTLVYKSSFDETSSNTEINNNVSVLENKSDDFIYRQTFMLQNDGLYLTETYQKIKVFLFFKSERKITYNKGLLKIPFPLKKGQTWNNERTEYCDGDSNKVFLTSKCVGIEEISLPAGKFRALKIESFVKSDNGGTSTVEEWITPEIGLVKVRALMQGGGLTGTIQKLLGYSELVFELKEIKKK